MESRYILRTIITALGLSLQQAINVDYTSVSHFTIEPLNVPIITYSSK